MAGRFTDEEIRSLVGGVPISGKQPWLERDEEAIEGFYRRLLTEIEEKAGATIQAEFDHYHSGYASYIDAFIYPNDDSTRIPSLRKPQSYTHNYKGIVLLLSRIDGFYTFATGHRGWSEGNSASYLPCSKMDCNLEEPSLARVAQTIRSVLDDNGLLEVPLEQLQEPLDAQVTIPSILDDPPWKQFDALYHWED